MTSLCSTGLRASCRSCSMAIMNWCASWQFTESVLASIEHHRRKLFAATRATFAALAPVEKVMSSKIMSSAFSSLSAIMLDIATCVLLERSEVALVATGRCALIRLLLHNTDFMHQMARL